MDVTHENGSLRRGWQCPCPGELKPILSFGPALWNGFGSLSLQTSPNDSEKCNFVEEALSNSLVLRKIFTFLNDWDLESCCHVSQNWRIVADPLVFSRYEIELAKTFTSHNPSAAKHYIFVRERERYNQKHFTQRKDFAGVTQIFEALLTQKVSISLRVSKNVDIQNEKVMGFLSKIGHLVLDLDVSEITRLPMSIVDFWKLLLQKFPNLNKLKCCGFNKLHRSSLEERNTFNTDSPQNKHKQLRIISFGNQPFSLSDVKIILKIAQNLEAIQDFPLELINAIVDAQKGQALKSLVDTYHSPYNFAVMGETVLTAYGKLAKLKPKLTSLVFNSHRFPQSGEKLFKLVKPFLFSIMRSSHESLESLLISPLRSDEVKNFPKLKGLKSLELFLRKRKQGYFFPPGMPVTDIFPNVSKIISTSIWDERYIMHHLRQNTICPWGTQINQLKIAGLPVSCIQLAQRLFPSVQQLRMSIPTIDAPKCLLTLYQYWPQLKSLTIIVDGCWEVGSVKPWDSISGRPWRLDHAFTGLPEEVIDQLADSSMKKDFTPEEIQGFKDQSIISKFSELKELKLLLSDYDRISGPARRRYMQLTPVANEFGFKLLPELKVEVGIRKDQISAEKMKTDLEPLGLCSNIEIVDDYDDTEW